MKKYVFTCSNENEMNYLVYTPNEMKKQLPLIVYLHGAGERGKNYEHLNRHGLAKLLHEGVELEAVVLCPQCPALRVWDNVMDDLKEIIDRVVTKYLIDKERISITGSSMGGFGTWMAGLTFPNFFSAIAPVAGGGMSWRASKLRKTPVFAYHGDKDSAVPVIYSELMTQVIEKNGGAVKLCVLKGYEHNDGIDYAYRHTDLIENLLNSRRTDFEEVPEICADLF